MSIFSIIKKIFIITLITSSIGLVTITFAQEPALPSGDNNTADDSLLPPRDTIPTSRNDAAARGQVPTQLTSGFVPNQGSVFGNNVNMNEVSNIFGQVVPANGFGGAPLNTLLNQIFYIGLGIAVVLALIMIVRGGIQYMTIDAATSKDSGKKMVQAALGGLTLAFAGILILNTINPNLTTLNLSFQQLQKGGSLLDTQILNAVAAYNSLSDEQYAELVRTGKIPTDISPAAQKILAEALNSVGTLKTGAIPGTDGGNKACAAALNKIVEAATGQQVGGGLSTAAMYTALQNNPKYQLVGSNTANALPGDIIISPTSGGATGHVGIVATPGAGQIISNSSKNAEVRQNHSASSWNSYYGGKGLPVYIYRPL